jgi:hypothetical protein
MQTENVNGKGKQVDNISASIRDAYKRWDEPPVELAALEIQTAIWTRTGERIDLVDVEEIVWQVGEVLAAEGIRITTGTRTAMGRTVQTWTITEVSTEGLAA